MLAITDEEKSALRARCTRFLSLSRPKSPADWVAALSASPNLDLDGDIYNAGPAIGRLERTVADLLGKEAALWFHKGVVAQQAVFLAYAARGTSRTIVLHPKSHLAIDEDDALERLAGLTALRLGTDYQHFGVEELQRIAEPVAAVTLELPLRRSGFQAPPWDDLVAVSAWTRRTHMPFHLDGARLWEVQPWYGRPLAEIAALADSVYVSLYKGLGGMGGCVVAGPAWLIEAVKPWRLRYGGALFTAFPMIVTALDGLETALPRMGAYHRHAIHLAAAIDAAPGLTAFPNPPHCNAFQVHFDKPAQAMAGAALVVARETGTWLFNGFTPGPTSRTCFGELAVGEATLDWTLGEAVEALTALRERAGRDE